ncbi:alpha/beta fold hydrolase [Pseudarthrobacter sp. NPDC092439]|uniref:alpha/beta fold hydrolase n=1 Tax=unclassified Pseudarthrobacter TaxID=2647000 RepID=UPI0037F45D37
MGVRQESAAWAVTLRRYTIPTELGPCTVRVQQGFGYGSPATGAPEVYLHGAAGSWTSFRPLLSEASPRDRVLIDLPGWGESTGEARLEHLSIEAMGHAVTDVLNSLNYTRWNLVGHSMGGFLALHIAAAWPEQTASVAAISPTTFAVSEAARKPLRSLPRFPAFVGMMLIMRTLAALGPAAPALVGAVGATPLMKLLMTPFFADPRGISAGVIRRLGHDVRPAGFSAAARAVAHYDFDRWRGIRCAVLATRGESDVFTSSSDVDRLAATVPSVRAAAIQHCGHFANLEQPEKVLRLLEDLWSE